MTVELVDARAASAQQAFEFYDLGDMTVAAVGGWEVSTDLWQLPVFIARGASPSVRLTFVVRFAPAPSSEVVEAYFDV